MKIRKMLRSILLLLLMASGLSVFLSCKGLNPTPAFYTVTFDAQGGSTVTSLKVEHGKTVTQPDNPVKASFTFGGWYKEKECTTPWNFATDTVTANITLFAKWTPVAPATELFTITYSANPATGGSISAKSTDGTSLTSGKKIEKGTVLVFTAVPNIGYDISGWTGDATAEPDNKTTKLTVTKNSTVTVTFTLKKYTVTFDAQGGSAVAPLEVEHGKTVTQPDNPEKTPFAFGGWYKEKECTTPWNFATDTVTTATTLYAQWKTTIQFDVSKMTCWKNRRPLNTGAAVYENDRLSFASTLLPTGQTVEKWTVNGVATNTTGTQFDYTVKAEDVQSGTISIDYTEKTAAQTVIHFDPSKIECKKDSTTVNTGGVVYENDALSFIAINLPAGQTVKSWTVNGNEPTGALPWIFHYTVDTYAIQSGPITVAYIEKTAAQATIHFDSSKIKCFRFFGSDTTPDIPIADGGTVYEHDNLMCIAKLPAGKMVDSWTVNGTDGLLHMGNSGFYRVDKEDSDLRFDYTEKIAERLELKFDSSKIRCTKLYDKTPIAPGQREKGDVLIFRTVDGSAVLWKVNGNNIPGRRSYYMQEEYVNESVLEIDYE
ncbi:InlB B-repeat-containing protein [Treponema sp. OMZ 803]|uniref:InlB B-repeat-containing protein n=1 Tax=Treponema sp. OMZ 803 TaxID=120682 RepID=UPI0020A49C03|nr:InlB B-repeat-containing protein [Treponema sp. OMZ 803]UTC53723.1 InlB B-repeat-containing protein [Treponema sp. OMZ 803]